MRKFVFNVFCKTYNGGPGIGLNNVYTHAHALGLTRLPLEPLILGAILAPSWGVWGSSWLQVGGSGGHLGSKLGLYQTAIPQAVGSLSALPTL